MDFWNQVNPLDYEREAVVGIHRLDFKVFGGYEPFSDSYCDISVDGIVFETITIKASGNTNYLMKHINSRIYKDFLDINSDWWTELQIEKSIEASRIRAEGWKRVLKIESYPKG